MQAKIQKYGGFVLAGALVLALSAGIAVGGGEAISANLLGSNNGVAMGGGIPTILKEEQQRPGTGIVMGGGAPSILKDEPQRPADGFKVEIEGIVTEPNANPK